MTLPAAIAHFSEQRRLEAYLRNRLDAFCMKSFHVVDPGIKLQWNWHTQLMCEYLEAVSRNEINRLIINVPPRTMKSICVTVAWPAWLLGRDPAKRIISASYSSALSIKHNTDTRLIMESPWYKGIFPQTQIAAGQDTKSKFATTQRGFRLATSVGGTLTGEGGDVLIVDDPLNPAQAASETERETVNNWYSQTLSSRLNDRKKGAIVVVMQRLHQNDLTGYLKERGGFECCELPLYAQGKKTYSFGRVNKTVEDGELLHEARFPQNEVDRLKRELGSYGFASQYMQQPAPVEGGIVKLQWFKRYKAPQLKYKMIVQSWDTASKTREINDPSCCTTFGIKEDGYDVLDNFNARLEYPELKRKIVVLANKWEANVVLIEDRASGMAAIQELRRETTLPIIAMEPCGEKIVRMVAESAKVEAGLVSLPEDAPWLHDWEQNVMLFPNATHDEEVDTLSQFLKWISKPRAQPRIRSL